MSPSMEMEGKGNLSFVTTPFDGTVTPPEHDKQPYLHRPDASENSNSNHFRSIGGGQHRGPVNELDRYLSSKPIISFGLTLQASWEAVAISFKSTLLNGGPSTLVYGCILSSFGSAAMAATLGEMASMKPCVGAQYRLVMLLIYSVQTNTDHSIPAGQQCLRLRA